MSWKWGTPMDCKVSSIPSVRGVSPPFHADPHAVHEFSVWRSVEGQEFCEQMVQSYLELAGLTQNDQKPADLIGRYLEPKIDF